MRALQVQQISPDLSGCALTDVPLPCPGEGQVLVRVHAASLNFPDLLMTRGLYQHRPPLPFVPGMDISGEVTEAPPRSGLSPGDAVVGAVREGGLADYVLVDRDMVRRKPASLDHDHAAAFGAAYLTAHVGLVRCGALRSGQWLLVHGSSGGVGLAAVDLGRALGARVIAASGSADKLAVIARAYDPEATLVSHPGFREQVKALTGGGADLIYDPVGGDVFDESARCVAFGGRLLIVGFASGRISSIAANIPLIKGFSVVGVRAGEYTRRFPEAGRESLDTVWSMAAEGRLHPRVHAALPIERWREAFEAMDGRQLIGKMVLRFAPDAV